MEIDRCVALKDHSDRYAVHQANKCPILALLQSLLVRNAIPKERLSYWNDPDYNTGRLKTSHKGVFERNGCSDQGIYSHPNFIRALRHLLSGAELPEIAIAAFEAMVGNPVWASSGFLSKPIISTNLAQENPIRLVSIRDKNGNLNYVF